MEYKLKTDDVKRRFREYEVSGDVTVQNLEPLVAEMKDCVSSCDELCINLVGITEFDTSALQFFYAVKNSFVRDRKKLRVTCDLAPEVSQLLANCGVTDLAHVLSFGVEQPDAPSK
ncbi:MAG: STAS domain-containing protein [Bacteroidales bacterium]|jgi:ABC-type transporter Mla MlaB component|nr:STAS domain-containing protein [Bacteroidales bacterium]